MIVHLAGELATDLDGADAALEDSGEHAFNGMFETTFKPFETHGEQVRAATSSSNAANRNGRILHTGTDFGFVRPNDGQ
jgi:hypothetical protein